MSKTHGCGNESPHILRRMIRDLIGIHVRIDWRILIILILQLRELATELGGLGLLREALGPSHQRKIGIGGFLVRIEGNVGLLGLLFLLSLLGTSVVELKEKKRGTN